MPAPDGLPEIVNHVVLAGPVILLAFFLDQVDNITLRHEALYRFDQ